MSDPTDGSTGHGSRLLDAGEPVDEVKVSIGPKFLHLFSEQLYTSPNKAFEELISNSWDAGAGVVYIGIPADLASASTVLWVLDDGVSMDVESMRLLWAVGDDHKAREGWEASRGREQIGKFGIGKLATYVLANQLTYICKAPDGVVRAVSVDYRDILERGEEQELHVDPLPLSVRELDEAALVALLNELGLTRVAELLVDGRVARPEDDESSEDEFHARDHDAIPESSNTWTLAVMSALKARGQSVSAGRLRRMLRSALPLGDTITLVLNDESLTPTKIEAPLQGQWVIGSDFAPATISPEGAADDDDAVTITASAGQDPHVDIPGVGRVTGEVKLYEASIAGGKSAERGASNGFHVNVRGRVINTGDEHFGMPALSHGVWAKLRVTVRADGLNKDLAVSRESVEDSEAVRRFRGFLRAAFNFARASYPATTALPDIHELLADRWGTVPISPLVHVVDAAVSSNGAADLVDLQGVEQGDAAAQEVRKSIEDHPENALRNVSAQPYGRDERLARYRLADRSVIINSDHPYWIEQLTSVEADKREVLTTAATVSLLGDAYLVELGVAPELVDDLRDYRDQVERLIASSRRRSALTLASLLDEASTERMSLENLVAECLEHLGFYIQHQAQTGKPEGIATADLAPDAEERGRRYRFIYEAKSTTAADRKVSTKDVNVSGQDRHRRHAARDTDDEVEVQHALVVAPGFQSGALKDECGALNVCPMRTSDLGRLIVGAAVSGPLDQERFRRVLEQGDPDDVAREVTALIEEARKRTTLTIAELVDALDNVDNVGRLNAGMVALLMRERRREQDGARHTRPDEDDVRLLLSGLQRLAPSAVQVVGDQIVLGTSPRKLAEAIRAQASALPQPLRFELDRLAESS